MKTNYKKATFAGGCFWCIESAFAELDGVIEAISGYTGGHLENPTYEKVSSGKTGHQEAVQVVYDPKIITYKELLDVYWRRIDPTDSRGQFSDKGEQYLTAIFYHNDEQKVMAEKSKAELSASGVLKKPVVTEIKKIDKFYIAEDYHQGYYKTNPERYKQYEAGSGRDRFVKKTWGEKKERPKSKYKRPENKELKEKLTPMQFKITRECGTEQPFNNEYWDNKEAGIYVDIVTGEPLFSSLDKYNSGTGWPSFTKPIKKDNITQNEDLSLNTKRIEVKSKLSDSHLGHVFPDGPEPTRERYCINSAALRFIPLEKLEKEGYKEYLNLFK